jgi:hypothetical protein
VGAEAAGLVVRLTVGVAVATPDAVGVTATVTGAVVEAAAEGLELPEQAAVNMTSGRTTSRAARISASVGQVGPLHYRRK